VVVEGHKEWERKREEGELGMEDAMGFCVGRRQEGAKVEATYMGDGECAG